MRRPTQSSGNENKFTFSTLSKREESEKKEKIGGNTKKTLASNAESFGGANSSAGVGARTKKAPDSAKKVRAGSRRGKTNEIRRLQKPPEKFDEGEK